MSYEPGFKPGDAGAHYEWVEDDINEPSPSWWVMDMEPEMDDLATQAGDSLKSMVEALQINPFQDTQGNDKLFLARFEFPVNGADFQYPEAILPAQQQPLGWMDFLAGFHVDDLTGLGAKGFRRGEMAALTAREASSSVFDAIVEMLLAIGQYSSLPPLSDPSKVTVTALPGNGKATPPIPPASSESDPISPKPGFFQWPDIAKLLMNLTTLYGNNPNFPSSTAVVTRAMAPNLSSQPAPTKGHWWFRVNLKIADANKNPPKFPVPGEFLALAPRMMPDRPWGAQKSSPFMYSGNWCDTVFYSSGVITEVIDPTTDVPYSTYKVQWRTTQANSDGIVTATPSDFAEYKVKDRVTILKDVAATKTSQLWSDSDMSTFGDNWMIVPISFYGLETPATGG